MRDWFGNLIKEDLLTGRKKSKKTLKKEILAENRQNGKSGEDTYRVIAMANGEELERAPHGKDFISRKRNPFTGKVERTTHIEIKTGKAKLSKLQQKTKKQKRNYKIIRVNPFI